uniref:ASCH domain-containing protein n=1 Tax=Caudovirales sp. ctu3532 TaxID=2827639 RepID=A0A8S5TIN1_9CAUD|nr:MAG TPA: hypothetical protein [Caudovirales sp. ctu3532]
MRRAGKKPGLRCRDWTAAAVYSGVVSEEKFGWRDESVKRAVLISIRPKWCEKIASGKKTIEVRRNFPKLDVPFKVYIYCTRQKLLMKSNVSGNLCVERGKKCKEVLESRGMTEYSGKIIGEFVCRTMEEFTTLDYYENTAQNFVIAKDACMTLAEMTDYEYKGHSPCLFGWHISDLVIYDKPVALEKVTGVRNTRLGVELYQMERAPQSWCYVEEQKWND